MFFFVRELHCSFSSWRFFLVYTLTMLLAFLLAIMVTVSLSKDFHKNPRLSELKKFWRFFLKPTFAQTYRKIMQSIN